MPGYGRYRRHAWAQRPVFATSTCTLRRPLSFHYAEVATDNLGGWCREYRPPASGYNTDIGTCTSTCTQFDDTASCTTANETDVLLTGVGGVEPGTTIDLRIANQTRYVPFDATQNRLNGDWAEINVLGNEPTTFEFCFLDHVRRSRPGPLLRSGHLLHTVLHFFPYLRAMQACNTRGNAHTFAPCICGRTLANL